MLRWVFPALISGLVAIMAFFPMSWAAGWFLPDNVKSAAPDLTVRGTIWHGSVFRFTIGFSLCALYGWAFTGAAG